MRVAVCDSTIRRGNGLTLWSEELLLARNFSVVVVFSLWSKCSNYRDLCGRVGSAAQNPPCAIAHPRYARDAHALLSKMDSGRARADGSDHGFDRPEVHGQRKDAAMAPRSAGWFYFSRGSSARRDRSCRESRLRFTRVVLTRLQLGALRN